MLDEEVEQLEHTFLAGADRECSHHCARLRGGFLQTKCTLARPFGSHARYLPKEAENLCAHKPHKGVYRALFVIAQTEANPLVP